MNILTVNVRPEESPRVVEFVGEADEKILIFLTDDGEETRNALLERAVAYMVHAVKCGEVELGKAIEHVKRDDENEALDKGLKDTFPASDPVSVTTSTIPASADPKS